jgi:wyosine [tRNA(Phe)-imidazoG37] synthetase (radical SAM superfamily)
VSRREFVSVESVLAELEDWQRTAGDADFITLSGSGEPTLHSCYGEVLEFIRLKSSIPAALLTNGTMLHLPEVRKAACHADLVKVSLSAWDQMSYQWVNRPHPALHFEQLLAGQKDFRVQFGGQLWMEVFLVGGINSMPADVCKIAALAKEISPDRIQLNTTVRPPAEDFVAAVSKERLAELAQLFEPPAEIITECGIDQLKEVQVDLQRIFAMLKRRPCTLEEISNMCGLHHNEVSKYLGSLLQTKHILTDCRNGAVHYTAEKKRGS